MIPSVQPAAPPSQMDLSAGYCLRCGEPLLDLGGSTLRCTVCGFTHSLEEPDVWVVGQMVRRLRRAWRWSDAFAVMASLGALLVPAALWGEVGGTFLCVIMMTAWFVVALLGPLGDGPARRFVLARQMLILGAGLILLVEAIFWLLFVVAAAAPAFPPGFIAWQCAGAMLIVSICVVRVRLLGKRIEQLIESIAREMAFAEIRERIQTPPHQRGGQFIDRLFQTASSG